jgi:hypothetical protein
MKQKEKLINLLHIYDPKIIHFYSFFIQVISLRWVPSLEEQWKIQQIFSLFVDI